jgi:hypothetical protein
MVPGRYGNARRHKFVTLCRCRRYHYQKRFYGRGGIPQKSFMVDARGLRHKKFLMRNAGPPLQGFN